MSRSALFVTRWVFFVVVPFFFVGCDMEQSLEQLANQIPATRTQQADSQQTTASETSDQQAPNGEPAQAPTSAPPDRFVAHAENSTIRIASFNIQVFGISKLKKPEVMSLLAKVLRHFDVVAIQEVRSKDQNAVPRLVQMVNAEGRHYDYVLGPRLGRTSSKEQYTFLFDTQRIEVNGQSIYTISDPQDYLHREPLVATFRVRGLPPREAFTFTLINIHTDPDETDIELDALDDVFLAVQKSGNEDDVILLGDLNVDEHHFGELGRLPGIAHVISGVTTNTRRSKMYDNMLFNRYTTSEYTGQSGVFDLMAAYGLSQAMALKVSDHFPIWAEFNIRESTAVGPIVSRPDSNPR